MFIRKYLSLLVLPIDMNPEQNKNQKQFEERIFPLLEDQSFDVFQRFSAIIRIICSLPNEEKLNILDVGGYPGTLADFIREMLPDASVITVDRPICPRKDYISGSAARIPFQNETFDVVISSDMLEHIPGGNRGETLQEIRRVSRRWIILGAPFASPCNIRAERELNEIHRKAYGKSNPWLCEHIENTLPNLEETGKRLTGDSGKAVITPNGSSVSWFIMQSLKVMMDALPLLSEKIPELNRKFNRLFGLDDLREPSYRYIITVDKTGKIPESVLNQHTEKQEEDNAEERIAAAAELFQGGIDLWKSLIPDELQESGALSAGYIRQLEEIIEFQEKEQKNLKTRLDSREEYLNKIESNLLFRILKKSGLLHF